ncbi:MAG: hypothetical protein RL550_879 [Actinomycetota bacterium]
MHRTVDDYSHAQTPKRRKSFSQIEAKQDLISVVPNEST